MSFPSLCQLFPRCASWRLARLIAVGSLAITVLGAAGDEQAQFKRAQELEAQKNFPAAEAIYTKLIDADPVEPTLYAMRGWVRHLQKNEKAALHDLDMADMMKAKEPATLLRRGLVHKALDDQEKAAQDFAAVAAADAGNVRARYELAYSLSRSRRHREALKAITEAIALDPTRADLVMLRSAIHEKLGEGAAALADADLARTLTSDPKQLAIIDQNRPRLAALAADPNPVAQPGGLLPQGRSGQGRPANAPVPPTPPAPAATPAIAATPIVSSRASLVLGDQLGAAALAGGRPGGDILATKALLRLLGGPLDAEQEAALNKTYAAAYAHPTPKLAAHHRGMNQRMIDVFIQREIMLRTLRERDAASRDAMIAGQLGDESAKQEHLAMIALQDRMIADATRQIAALSQQMEAAGKVAALDNPPAPAASPERQAYALACRIADNLEALQPKVPVIFVGKWVLEKIEKQPTGPWDSLRVTIDSLSITETSGSVKWTYLDHGSAGRRRSGEELKGSFSVAWDPPPAEIRVTEEYSSQPPISLKLSARDTGTRFVPADYATMPYACYGAAKAWIHVYAHILPTDKPNASGYDHGPWQTSSDGADAHLGRTAAETVLQDTKEVQLFPCKPLEFREPGAGVTGPNVTRRAAINFDFPGGRTTYVYRYVSGVESAADETAGPDSITVANLPEDKQAAAREHLTNIAFAKKAITGFRRDLANAKDNDSADQIRFNILHLEQDIHDSNDLLESLKTGKIVHTAGPWEKHAEAVAAQNTLRMSRQIESAHHMQASALKLAAILGQYSPADAQQAHQLILSRISTGTFQPGGLVSARQALDQIHAMTGKACVAAQQQRYADQASAQASLARVQSNLDTAETIKRYADRSMFVGTLFTPMGAGAVLAIAYEGTTVGIEKGPVAAVKQVAKDALIMGAMVGTMKVGEALVAKYLNPTAALSAQESFSIAKYNQELKFNETLVARVKETQSAVATARKGGAAAGDLARLEAAATEAASVANSSALAKRVMKNELVQAQEALAAANKQVQIVAKNPAALAAAKKAQTAAAERFANVEKVHSEFSGTVQGIYAKVDDVLVNDLREQGYNVEPSWFMEFRNATSKGVNADRDMGLLAAYEAQLRLDGKAVSLEKFMDDAKKSYNSGYRKFNSGRSATLADQSVTTTAHSEAFPLEFLDSSKVGTASGEACERVGKTIKNKVVNALKGLDPEVVNFQKACASLSKDLKTKLLKRMETAKPVLNINSAELQQAAQKWEDVAHIMDDFAKGRIDPATATQQMRLLTGGRTMAQVADDAAAYMKKIGGM